MTLALCALLVQQALAVGDKVPDFRVTDTSGKAWTLAELRKKSPSGVVSLTFWCTFCHSCRKMDARFDALAGEFAGKAFVAGLDASAADTAEKVETFRRERKFSVPVFMDDGKAAELFGVRVTTTTLVIDKEGVLRYRGQFGPEDAFHAKAAVQALLDGKDVPVKETPPSG